MLDKPVSKYVKLDWERTLYLAIILLALLTRLWGLGDRVQSHDESIHTKYSWNLYVGRGFEHNPLMHGPFLFHATALSYFLFDDNDFTARLPVALIGVVIVAFPYFLRRWLGRSGALATSFFLLISPSIAYYSRYIRHDIPTMLWALMVVLAILSYLRDGRHKWLCLMAAGVSLTFATKEVAFIYNAIFGLFLVVLFAIQAMGRKWKQEDLKFFFLISLAVMVVGASILATGVLLKPEEQLSLPWWAISGGAVAGLSLIAAAVCLLVGVWDHLREYRSFDLIIVLGTLCLPFLSPLLITLASELGKAVVAQSVTAGAAPFWANLATLDPIQYTAPHIWYSLVITIFVIVVSVAIGLLWDWRRWGIAAAIHYGIYIVLFTTVLTNGYGIPSGFVGSLGYWLKQQEVERGSQPQYYYFVMTAFYEYLPFFLCFVVAPIYLFVRRVIRQGISPPKDEHDGNLSASKEYFLPFVFWWVVLAWISYSVAGERMPWLTVHLALPMIVVAGWVIGQLLERIDWRQVIQRRAWLLALIAPPFVMAVAMFISAARSHPFQGYDLVQLYVSGRLVSAFIGIVAFGAGLGLLIWRSGWQLALRVLLLVALLVPVFITMRTAWHFCYVNYDYPTEFLVYAHAAPGVHEAMDQIEEISRRTLGDPTAVRVAYGSDGSTLWYWQLRDFPNAVFYGENPSREQIDAPIIIAGRDQWPAVSPYTGDNYLMNEYSYIWWPMQDYFNIGKPDGFLGLDWQKMRDAVTDPDMLLALWRIWYDRDYRKYDEVTGKNHTLDEWLLRGDFRLYIRRDVAAQMWDLSTTQPSEEVGLEDPYADGWRDLAARTIFGSPGAGPGYLQSPRGVEVGPDGSVYVADAGNHRIQKFTAAGEFVATWGTVSDRNTESETVQGFMEPWDVAVAPDGSLYVADTWNHRIQKLNGSDGRVLTAWGWFGEFTTAGDAGQNAFYGPRGIATGPGGLVYVADTGNKRIQAFDLDGQYIRQWGGGGILPGYLDEPVGIDVGPQGAIYVADTWNRRVQVFDQAGNPLRQWPIAGWDTALPEEKPYLAVDALGYVYVTDPGRYRVLVFDGDGSYVFSFGQRGTDERSFGLPLGIDVAQDGTIYVTDAHNSRVMVFDSPLELE